MSVFGIDLGVLGSPSLVWLIFVVNHSPNLTTYEGWGYRLNIWLLLFSRRHIYFGLTSLNKESYRVVYGTPRGPCLRVSEKETLVGESEGYRTKEKDTGLCILRDVEL